MYRVDSILRHASDGLYNSYWWAIIPPRVDLNGCKNIEFRVQDIDTEEYTTFDTEEMLQNIRKGNIVFQIDCSGSKVLSIVSKRAVRCIDKFWYIGAVDPSWGMTRGSAESLKFRDLKICPDVFNYSRNNLMKFLNLFPFDIAHFCSSMMSSDDLLLLDILAYKSVIGADGLEAKGGNVCTTIIDLLLLEPEYFMFYNEKVYLKGGDVAAYEFGYDSKILLEML